jgi:hypothetical protein
MNPLCGDAEYSNHFHCDQLTAGQQTAGGTYTPNAATLSVYNNTNTIVTFNNVPYNPGGFACFDELNKGCYNQPIQISFANPAHTGAFMVNKTVKLPA